MAYHMDKWVVSSLLIISGSGIFVCAALVLLVICSMPMINPSRPDYYAAYLQKVMEMPGLGFITWPATAGAFFGLVLFVLGMIRPFLDQPPED